jgi:hypothetical protein
MAVQSLVKYSNYFKTTLSATVATGASTIDVRSVSGLPTITGSEYYYLTITRASDNAKEIVKVTSLSTLELTVTRAQDSTTALAFAVGDKVELLVVSALLDDLYSELSTEIDKIDFADASVSDHQDDTKENSIADLVDDAGGGGVLIHLAAGTYTFTTNYTIPRDVTLVFEDGAMLSPTTGITVTIEGRIRAGYDKIFTGDGSVSITQHNPVLVEWWGGYGDDSTDCATPIADAYASIPATGGTVLFTNGVYRVASGTYLGSAANPHQQAKFLPGAMIGTVGSITLTAYCHIDAGRHQIFSRASGSGTFTGDYNSTVAYPEWFKQFFSTTDSRAAIEDAIAFLPAGGLLSFQHGRVYSIDEDIDVTKSLTIEGGVITLLGTPASGLSAFHVTADDVVIRNLSIDISNVTAPSDDYSGIFGSGADDLVIHNVKIDAPDNTTYSAGSYHAGVYLDDCDRARITSVHVVDAEKDGLVLEDCENCVISDVTIKSAGQHGVSIHGGEHNALSNVNVVTPSGSGIYLNSSDYVSMSNINVDTATADGMLLNIATNTSITGGSIKAANNSNSGISMTGAVDGVTVTGVRITGYTSTSSAAVETTGAAKNIAIVGCNLQGNYAENDFHSDTTNTKITGNILGGVQESYLYMVDEKANRADSQSLSAGSWTTRDLTKKDADTGGYANLDTSTGQFTLAPGTYRFFIRVPAYNVSMHQARLYDVTNSKLVQAGSSEFSYGDDVHPDLKGNSTTWSTIVGAVAISVSTTFKIEHWVNAGTGIAPLSTLSNDNESPEIYTQVQFWRITEEAISNNALSNENHVSFEFDATDGKALGTYAIGRLPDNCIVTRSWYEVIETFTSTTGGTDLAALAIGIETDDVDGIKAATTIVSGTDWDAGNRDGIQDDGSTAKFSEKTTGDRDVQVDVTVQPLDDGKLILHLTYIVSE